MTGNPLLRVTDLSVEFRRGRNRPVLRAVDGVSFDIATGETLGLVGESGSGKTTIGRAILGLTPIAAGELLFEGRDITHADRRERRELSSSLQAVFQDPYSSLNPTRRVEQTLLETVRAQRVPRERVQIRMVELLERVGLPSEAAKRYPAHFSGGQRQRIAIARALMVRPRIVVADEPTSALDLSVQASVLNLLRELQEELGLSYLFVSHDLAVVRHLSHRIMVLYNGRVMELGEAEAVCNKPRHPYTESLLAAVPVADPAEQARRRELRHPSKAYHGSPGVGDTTAKEACPFAGRCSYAVELCTTKRPELEIGDDGGLVACHRWRELDLVRAMPARSLNPEIAASAGRK